MPKVGLFTLSALFALACATANREPYSAGTATHFVKEDRSALCSELQDRFVGLPREEPAKRSADAPPIAGRLRLRDCGFEADGGIVRLSLGGPGWYFLETEEEGFRIQQTVEFVVGLVLTGEFFLESERGVASIHFRPTAEPQVSARVTNHVNVEPRTLFATILDALPFALVSAKTRRRIGAEVASRFEGHLQEGATFTLNLRNGDSDMTLGQLAAGERPRHAFRDGEPSLANERQLLSPGAAHVLGPFAPAEEMPFDVNVEKGPGMVYEAACAAEVRRSFLAGSAIPKLVPGVSRMLGHIEGPGAHHTSLTLDDCSWYLVTTSGSKVPSVIALRLRPGFEPGWM